MIRYGLYFIVFLSVAARAETYTAASLLAQNDAAINEFQNISFDYKSSYTSQRGMVEHSGSVIRSGQFWRQSFEVATSNNAKVILVEGKHYHFMRLGRKNVLGKVDENGEVAGYAKRQTDYNRIPDVTVLMRQQLYDPTIKHRPNIVVDQGDGLVKLTWDSHQSLVYTIDTQKNFYPVKIDLGGAASYEVELQQVEGHWLPAKFTQTGPDFRWTITISNVKFPEAIDENLFTYNSVGITEEESIQVYNKDGEENVMKLAQLRTIPDSAYNTIREPRAREHLKPQEQAKKADRP